MPQESIQEVPKTLRSHRLPCQKDSHALDLAGDTLQCISLILNPWCIVLLALEVCKALLPAGDASAGQGPESNWHVYLGKANPNPQPL